MSAYLAEPDDVEGFAEKLREALVDPAAPNAWARLGGWLPRSTSTTVWEAGCSQTPSGGIVG